ncbi:UDP-3-O-acyl-N-acetylglucosamine deacetylase [Hoeflea poritis]|uniref:UDP-3-O-acyl-N-acetylglucosamine deacetylase n=1 Tax=Hoeflea poritis TaxID=2993659 RepID=A0ABT4VQM7_9HYPH|nr:UDP-3-O-acyl-N-acetylglucosamine deacetylase [Hoeflea poritis]MDA4846480.1 UDP-3-O-acyl-N-acetylglucosamine deacetylase [Hoeflea poritis]
MSINYFGYQTTILNEVTLSGVGVHSGSKVSVTFKPAEADTGIVFKRTLDNGDTHLIRAVASQVAATDLCTVLGDAGGASVATVEHLMAAFYAMEIDNIIVEIDGAEVPIMDGSSIVFIEALDRADVDILSSKRRYLRVVKPVRIEAGASWAEFVPYEGTRFEIDIDFDCKLIGRQSWKGDISADTFRRELARARTFGFMRDVEFLWASGHALGSSLENSVVISDDDTVINLEGLRFENEFVRHKTLDAVGDLALAGAKFIGCYRSYRGGHKLNSLALKALLNDTSAYEVVETSQPRETPRGGELVAVSGPMFAPWTQ